MGAQGVGAFGSDRASAKIFENRTARHRRVIGVFTGDGRKMDTR